MYNGVYICKKKKKSPRLDLPTGSSREWWHKERLSLYTLIFGVTDLAIPYLGGGDREEITDVPRHKLSQHRVTVTTKSSYRLNFSFVCSLIDSVCSDHLLCPRTWETIHLPKIRVLIQGGQFFARGVLRSCYRNIPVPAKDGRRSRRPEEESMNQIIEGLLEVGRRASQAK